MSLLLLKPGSFAWLVAHDLRLNWRRFAGMLSGFSRGRGLLVALAAVFAMHALAWPATTFLDPHMQGQSTPAESRVAIAALLVCIASWMLAQGLFAATRILYDRGDLDLLYGSPVPTARILAAKATAIAFSSLGSVALLTLPVANVGALRLGPHWLSIYPALAGIALLATAAALALTIVLFHLVGPRRARVVAHLMGAVIGGAFVLGAQIVALLPESVRLTLTVALAPSMRIDAGILERWVWLPVDATLAEPVAVIALLIAGLGAFFLAAAALGDRFARASLDAIGSPNQAGSRSVVGAFRSEGTPWSSLRRKEWRLLLRDPSLFAQLGLQIVYTIPLAVVLVRSGTLPLALALTPAIVVIAAQVAASLAWIAVSGEDAPELIASAPITAGAADLAKLSAIAIPVAVVTAVPIAGLALASPSASLIALAFAAGASASTTLLNLWHPMPASRRGMLRRHAQSKLIGLLEHILAILWAVAAVLALIGSLFWIVAVLLALAVLTRSRYLGAARAPRHRRQEGRPLAAPTPR